MNYLYAPNVSYENYASGRVLYHRTGRPNYPVRLAGEIFGRCLSYLGKKSGVRLYDPCCGGGYLLTVLGLLYPDAFAVLAGSDADEGAVILSRQNLALLTEDGLNMRLRQLEKLYEQMGKPSHLDAQQSARRFLTTIRNRVDPPLLMTFQSDALCPIPSHLICPPAFPSDIVFTDVPYGDLTVWTGNVPDTSAVQQLLAALHPVLHAQSVVALSTDKAQKIQLDGYRRLERIIAGKRRIELLRPLL